MELHVQLFGVFQVLSESASDTPMPVEWPRKQTQQLFKILVTERGRIFSQDQLIDLLFPDLEYERAVKNLHKRVSELRKALEPGRPKGQSSLFVHSPSQGNYQFLENAPCWIDVEAFNSALNVAQAALMRHEYGSARDQFQQALALYKGDFLAEDLYEEWSQDKRAQLRELRLEGLTGLARATLKLSSYTKTIEICSKIIRELPGREEAYSLMMMAHYFQGDSQLALATYEQCERALKIELGMSPSREIQDLYVQILNGTLTIPQPAVPNNLPQESSSFIGRAREIEALIEQVTNSRLVTITGVGGMGKSRLSLRVAESLLNSFPDGVWLLELAPLSDPAHIYTQLAQILEVREEQDRALLDKICQHLASKRTLLVLDNCEHLIESAASTAHQLLRACRNLKIIATSREPLKITGEVVWSIVPLSMRSPETKTSQCNVTDDEALQLFHERAQALRPSYQISAANAALINQICRKLDGMPLAIELAAAQVNYLSVEQIADRIQDRFSLLGQKTRSGVAHHQTLRAAMDWSYSLLSDQEKLLLNRLSIFRGGFTLDAVESVCADSVLPKAEILDLLRQLIDKSLVLSHENGQSKRFDLLETVRHYASEKWADLEPRDPTYARMLSYILQISHESTKELKEELSTEIANVRTALTWSLVDRNMIDLGMSLLIDLRYFWYYRSSMREGLSWFKIALPYADKIKDEQRAWFYLSYGIALTMGYALSDAIRMLNGALDEFRALSDKKGLVDSLQILFFIHLIQGRLSESLACIDESLILSQEVGDQIQYRSNLLNKGHLLLMHKRNVEAREHMLKSLQISRELKSDIGVCWCNLDLIRLEITEGNLNAARERLDEVTTLQESRQIPSIEVDYEFAQGLFKRARGELNPAFQHFMQSLKLAMDISAQIEVAQNLEFLADLLLEFGQNEDAVRCCAVADHRRRDFGIKRLPLDQPLFEATLQGLRATMNDVRFNELWNEATMLPFEQFISKIEQHRKAEAYGYDPI